MRLLNKTVFLLISFSLFSCAYENERIRPPENFTIEDIALEVSIPELNFDYIDRHFEDDGFLGIVFGEWATGAKLASNQIRDEKRRNNLQYYIADKKYPELVKKIIVDRLGEKNIAVRDSSHIKTKITSNSWGFRKENIESKLMTPYFEYNLQMMLGSDVLWDERRVYYGDSERSFGAYKDNRNLLFSDLDKMFMDAAQEIANKIIYK